MLHLSALLVLPGWGRAGEASDVSQAGKPEPTSEQPATAAPAAAEDAEAVQVDPCRAAARSATGEKVSWLDAMQQGIFMSVCASARWFDGFFGDARFDSEAERTWGRLGINTIWDQKDSFDVKTRFRARVELPNFDHRVNAFFGRQNERDFVGGRTEGSRDLPEFFRDTDDREWLIGLGYNPVGNFVKRVDFSVGVKLRSPLEPFVAGRYRHNWFIGDDRLARLRNTAFWRNQHGFGNTLSLDLEQALGSRFLGRFTNSATYSESTEGIDWKSSATLYQGLPGGLSALSWTAYLDGETDRPVDVERYGLRAIYRQQMLRKWFFGQLIAGVSWPRDVGEDREMSWELGFGFEVQYGQEP